MNFNYKFDMKKIIAAFTAVLISASFFMPYAEAAKSIKDLQNEMKQRESERKKTEEAIKTKKNERDARLDEKNSLDLQISDIMSDIDDVQSVIDEKQAEINDKQAEINELNGVITENNDKLKSRMKVMYEYGSSSYLDIILESKGLSDFFSRVSVIFTL